MSKIEFDEFIKQKRSDMDIKEEIDWVKEKEEWLAFLQQLYDQVINYLHGYIESGDVTLGYQDKVIREEFIGEYTTQKLLIRIQNSEVALDPIGTNLIGAKGRVDLKGDKGTARFVLVPENKSIPDFHLTLRLKDEQKKEPEEKEETISWVWKLSTPPPVIAFIDINEDSFFDALMEVING